MAYLSPAILSQYENKKLFNSKLIEKAKTLSEKPGVFLAHSSSDDQHIDNIVLFFNDFDAQIYADNYDKTLPKPPSLATAQTLKKRITDCSRFVVLVSPNSRSSRWIPWELGIADGAKGIARIAILPVTPNGDEESWTREEYFGLYPRIVKYSDGWKVLDPRDNKTWKIENWLHTSVS